MRSKLLKRKHSHTDTISLYFAVIIILGVINYFAEITFVWYIWNIAVIVAPLLFLATHLRMKDHASKYLVVVLLALASVGVIGMGLTDNWGTVEADSIAQDYWDIITFYVIALYAFLIGTKLRIE
ncbi:MAG: hypothetical protein F4X82_00295 [Candidatus Spechtbacteria bacterium SB0662_bin_43]|uniref:Uncharacterized protein n=1 Tax=Candidatus Spechtbacteria bacterium SB0662_bin_43 TaxID=2604897 RepID=A0A845D933_9BACT|nr:hypothetical protein [Candidatus Spechtbacteria bacterium SB0662_bin_43]